MKSLCFANVLCVLIGLTGICQAAILPLAGDGSVDRNGTNYTVRTDDYYGDITRTDSLKDDRIAMEFDLTGLEQPDSAVLTLWHLDGNAVGKLYAYPGNGMISTSDYSGTWVEEIGEIQMTMSALIGNLGGPSGYHWGYGVPFDVDVTQALSMAYEKGWSHLGLLLTHDGAGGRHFSLDGDNQNTYLGGQPPSLEYTPVPEPATLSLLAVGGLAVLRRRRAKKARPQP